MGESGQLLRTRRELALNRINILHGFLTSRFLFWTDVGAHPKIMRASLGGRKHRVVIEFVDQSIPTAITVDYAEHRYPGGKELAPRLLNFFHALLS